MDSTCSVNEMIHHLFFFFPFFFANCCLQAIQVCCEVKAAEQRRCLGLAGSSQLSDALTAREDRRVCLTPRDTR